MEPPLRPERQAVLAPTRKLVTDTFLVSGVGILSRAKGVLFIPLIVRAVGFGDYGAFVQIFVTAKLLATLTNCELGMGFERFLAPVEDADTRSIGRHFYSILFPAMGMALVGALLLYSLAGWFGATFFDGGHVTSLRVASLVVLSNTLHGVVRNFLTSRRRFPHQSGFSLLYEVGPYAAFVAAVMWRHELLPGIVAYTVVDGLVASSMLLFAIRGMRWAPPSWHLFRTYIVYSAPLALSNIEGGLLDRADRYFISAMLGLEAVGLYNVAYRCTELVGYMSIPIRSLLMPYLSAAWERGAGLVSTAMIRMAVLVFLSVTIGLLAVLALYSEPLLPYFAGAESNVSHLGLIVSLIGAGTLVNATRRLYAMIIRLKRTTHDEFLYQFVGLVLNIVGNALLIPVWGLVGAAVSTLVAYVAILPLVTRKYPLGLDSSFFGHMGGLIVIALAITPLRFLLPSDGLVALLLSAGLAYTAYLVLILLLKRRFFRSVRTQVISWQKQPC